MSHHIAQVNIARMKAPLDSPVMEGFVSRLEEINALADHSPGMLVTEEQMVLNVRRQRSMDW